jgi:hypothetical protein
MTAAAMATMATVEAATTTPGILASSFPGPNRLSGEGLTVLPYSRRSRRKAGPRRNEIAATLRQRVGTSAEAA